MGDFIVVRSDGSITYNLAVVVDDVTMEVTHVIRGDDHISNTPKQVVIYRALGAAVPEFLHMPLLFGTDKKKLSKRHGATKLEQLTAEGFLVEVVRNYLCFLSAEFDERMITWTLDDLVRDFDVTKLGTSPSIFDPEKLRWMNGRYVRAMTDEWLGGRLVEYLTRVGFYGDPAGVGAIAARGAQALARAVEDAETEHEPPTCPDEEQESLTREVAPLVHEKLEVLADFIPMAGWFFRPLDFTPESLEARALGRAGRRDAGARAAAGALAQAQGRVRRPAPRHERPDRHAGPLREPLGARPRQRRRAARAGGRAARLRSGQPSAGDAVCGRGMVSPRRCTAPGRPSVDEDEGEETILIGLVPHDVDRPSSVAHRGEDVDAAALHGRARLLGRGALPAVRACFAQVARPSAHHPGPVVSRQEEVALERQRRVVEASRLGVAVGLPDDGADLEEDAACVLREHALRHGDRLQVGRAGPAHARLVAAEQALHTHPLRGDDVTGVDRRGRIGTELQRPAAPLVGM